MALLGGLYTSNAIGAETVTLRHSYAGNLDFTMTGNTLLTGSDCNQITAGRSSQSNITNIPATANIEAAWLYWAGSYNPSSTVNTPDSNVTFTSPSGSRSVSATYTYVDNFVGDSTEAYFSGVADVTAYVSGNGNYGLSGLTVHTGDPHCGFSTIIAGWSLVVIYEDSSEPLRVVNVFDGFQYYYGSSINLIPDNFQVSSTPSGKHGHITWEGDAGNSGSRNGLVEQLVFQGQDLTDGNNPANNQFNSYSNATSSSTLGVDIDYYDISSYLSGGETSVTTQYSSGADMVFLSAEILSVSNVAVADLSVTTSNPTGWQEGSTVTKKFTVSNNGPNDVPTQSVRFRTTLPTDLTFNGVQGDSDWTCNQTGQTLSCIYQPKLRSGWSDYIDLTFDIANGTAGQNKNLSVTVDHESAPYEIFDNQASNDTYAFGVPIGSVPVVDLSASSKVPDNLNGDLLLAGDTLQYTITLDDASDLAVNGISITDDLPANISGYTITQLPASAVNNSTTTGGANGTGQLLLSNINLAAGATEQVVLEVYIENTAPRGASLQNTASITYGTDTWIVDTGDITIVAPDLSPSTIEAVDVNGGLLQPGDSVQVTITLDDQYDLDINSLQAQLDIPSSISSFVVDSIPSGSADNSASIGGSNGTGYIDVQNIMFASGNTESIVFTMNIDPATPSGI